MGQLSTYQTQVSLLLHDPNFQYFTQSVLTSYINEARNRVAQDTKCLRQLVGTSNGDNFPLIEGQDFYVPQTFLGSYGPYIIDVMGISIWWGTLRIKLSQLSYTQFDANLRRYATYQGRPAAFARMGAANIVIGPPADQDYPTDWDVCMVPQPLVSDSTAEQLPVPFQESVQYYAAFKAKFQEQAMGEAALFQQQYTQNLRMCLRSFVTRIIPNPYRIGA